jgi:hypothetical protein
MVHSYVIYEIKPIRADVLELMTEQREKHIKSRSICGPFLDLFSKMPSRYSLRFLNKR